MEWNNFGIFLDLYNILSSLIYVNNTTIICAIEKQIRNTYIEFNSGCDLFFAIIISAWHNVSVCLLSKSIRYNNIAKYRTKGETTVIFLFAT